MSAIYTPYIVRSLEGEDVDSVLEFACGDGQNLHAIKDKYPEITVTGFDILEYGYPIGDITEKIEYEDNSVDVVLIAATLLLYDEKKVVHTLDEAKRIARKLIILMEKQVEDGDFTVFPESYYLREQKEYNVSNRIVRDYQKLLPGLEIVSDAGAWGGNVMKYRL